MKKSIITILTASLLFSCSSEFLDKEPESTVSQEQYDNVIKEFPEKAFSMIQGIEAGNNKYTIQYNTVGSELHDDYGLMGNNLMFDHFSNDLVLSASTWYVHPYNYTGRQETSTRTKMVWNFNYKVIYNMNAILKLIPQDTNLSNLLILKARTLATRAHSYLILIRAYANGNEGIPYYSLEIDDQSRVPTSRVYELIEKDLLDAYAVLQNYNPADKQIISGRVTAGFLSRLYLDTKNYAKAAEYAKLARTGLQPMSEEDLFGGFSNINNPEWMWGADIDGSTSTSYASFFSHMDNTNEGYAGLIGGFKLIDKKLYQSIPSTDLRKEWFVTPGDTIYSVANRKLPDLAGLKFVDPTFFLGDYVFMRAAEMYLNEAEALAMSGNEAEAKQVLLELMETRDPQYTLSTNSGTALIEEIRLNRRIELWGEGFAFFDMKRWGLALERNYTDTNHSSFGRFNYPAGSSKFVLQIPIDEIRTNSKISQNPL